ncbi:MAG: recombinase family protein [Deltaproteobacteria bacterium]|nr:recombinase family protein [Deltaproteobacteria bacterium]
MGPLTLNMLMSFAEFEREMIAERTRDKIAASQRRGKWTGGPVPIGYDVVDKHLLVNDIEAVVVCSPPARSMCNLHRIAPCFSGFWPHLSPPAPLDPPSPSRLPNLPLQNPFQKAYA